MVDIFGKWRQRKSSQREDAATKYWRGIESLASGTLSERAIDAAFDAVEALLPELGKGDGDVAVDIEAQRAFNAAKVVADAAENERGTAADLRADAARLEQRAVELNDELERVRKQAEENRNRANSLCAAAGLAQQELGRARARLAQAGHSELSAGAAADAKAAQIASLLGELQALELGTAYGKHIHYGPDARRSEIVSKLRRLGHVVPQERLQKQLPGGRRSEVQDLLDELSNLERAIYGVDHGRNVISDPDARRAAIASRLRELGFPVDAERLSKQLPNSRRGPAAPHAAESPQ